MQIKRLTRPFELKSIDDDSGTITGYGSVFGIEDYYNDIVLPGAFAASISEIQASGRPLPMLWQHNDHEPIGSWDELTEDEHGLLMKGTILKNDVARAKEAYALAKAKVLTGLSIGYIPRDHSTDQKTGVRMLKQVELWETSLVTFPANDAARTTDVKSIKNVTDLERHLRQAGGLSRNEAKRVVHDIKANMRQACATEDLKQLIKRNIQTLENTHA